MKICRAGKVRREVDLTNDGMKKERWLCTVRRHRPCKPDKIWRKEKRKRGKQVNIP